MTPLSITAYKTQSGYGTWSKAAHLLILTKTSAVITINNYDPMISMSARPGSSMPKKIAGWSTLSKRPQNRQRTITTLS
jgi:hypothetical protein